MCEEHLTGQHGGDRVGPAAIGPCRRRPCRPEIREPPMGLRRAGLGRGRTTRRRRPREPFPTTSRWPTAGHGPLRRVGSSRPRPHPEVPKRSAGLEGGLQPAARSLEPSFEARRRGHLRMRAGMGHGWSPSCQCPRARAYRNTDGRGSRPATGAVSIASAVTRCGAERRARRGAGSHRRGDDAPRWHDAGTPSVSAR
jgi:hypothetical protein